MGRTMVAVNVAVPVVLERNSVHAKVFPEEIACAFQRMFVQHSYV